MNPEELRQRYKGYIDCLNSQDWKRLEEFVDKDVEYNGKLISLSGYRKMLEGDFKAIPDLRFNIAILSADPPMIASRLDFDCTPIGMLFGMPVNGKRVQFSENVFYEFRNGRIVKVWSLIDTAEISRQISRQ